VVVLLETGVTRRQECGSVTRNSYGRVTRRQPCGGVNRDWCEQETLVW